MPPKPTVDDRLRQLREIRDGGDLVQIRTAVCKSLKDPMNLVVAEAARLVGELDLHGLELELQAAWDRLRTHDDPIKVDKSCWAKAAIIEALGRLSFDEPEVYLDAVSYVQLEPAWGKSVDTAENVRAAAAFALARSQKIRAVDKLVKLVDLLTSLVSPADRVNAIKAITDTGSESAIPILRLKLLSGDSEAEVLGLCMTGLIQLAPVSSMPVVSGFLDDPNENVVYEAAAALGIYGRPEAVASLIVAFKKSRDPETQRSLLLSIGLSRDTTAVNFLIAQLESNRHREDVLDALQPSCVYQEIQTRVRDFLEKSGDKKALAAFDLKLARHRSTPRL